MLNEEYFFIKALGCSVQVRSFFDMECSGKQSCSVRVADQRLVELGNCPDDANKYLEIAYNCVPTVPASSSMMCLGSKGSNVISDLNMGLITSQMFFESAPCQWKIETNPGQQINFTLMYFGPNLDGCQRFVSFTEMSDVASPCAIMERINKLYVSKTNSTSVTLIKPNVDVNFLLKFEGQCLKTSM